MIAVNSQTNQEIANQADDKYHTVEANQNPFVDGRKHVRLDSVNVVVVRLAIIIRARFIANEFNHVIEVGTVQLVGAIILPVGVVVESFHFAAQKMNTRKDDLNVWNKNLIKHRWRITGGIKWGHYDTMEGQGTVYIETGSAERVRIAR